MTYIDGFVFIVKKKNIADYKKMATMGGKMWKKHGAIEYIECMGDDMGGMGAGTLTFPKMTKAKKDETVWFSFIVYKSKAHRNAVNKKVMKDPAMNEVWKDKPMPFDMKKMAYGGFKSIVKY